MVTQVPAEGLTSVEQSLVEFVGRGEWLDLAAGDRAVDEAAMRSWGESRTISGDVIRDILRGRLAANPDPHGLRLRGARIIGQLDLENLTSDVNLELRDCLLEKGIVARDAHLAAFTLTGCQIEHPAEPPLDATALTCSVLSLSGVRIIGHADAGAVLLGAHIGGNLECSGARLQNDGGPALLADGLQVDQAVLLRNGFTATGVGDHGAVRLVAARIGGNVDCAGANLYNNSGPALNADSMQVGLGVFLRNGFTAIGTHGGGAVRLAGAHIGGSLECSGARLQNDAGPVLSGAALQVGLNMFLRNGFTATGTGQNGAISLVGAQIGGQLSCIGVDLRNNSGPALNADSLQVGQGMFLRNRFTATGADDHGAVRLVGARIGGQLDCIGVDLRNNSGPALSADSLQVGQGMNLVGGFSGGGKGATVDLTGARVGGAFRFAPTRLEHRDGSHRLDVDGLTYVGVPETTFPPGWRELLRDGTPRYAAQPYQQLAAGYRTLGDDQQVRQTLMAQRDDQLARTHPGRWERLWGRITKITLGYGYQPWRALLFLAAVIAVSCVLAVLLGSHGALAQTSKTATPGRPCTVLQQISVGLDLNLPVGTSVARAQCDLTTDSGSLTATWLAYAGWALRVLAWGFAALFVAGFTSAVRKT